MSLTKIAGSGSRSVSQMYGSADPDPDPYRNITVPTVTRVSGAGLLSGWTCEAQSHRGEEWKPRQQPGILIPIPENSHKEVVKFVIDNIK
jgi:hypothetical protein